MRKIEHWVGCLYQGIGVMGISLAALFFYAHPIIASADENNVGSETDNRLFEMSIEELMSLRVTSVSKKEQKLSESAAAVFVITNEDIRRSGATSIPEVLRMVPGLQVARIDANKWAVTSRGGNGYFANKLLVLVDGRSVYSPLFSGVFWDLQDYPLQDVDRIEIIRGPGGTLWGANAVNGVINILTKSSKDTQGTLVEAGVGTEERGFGTIRFGGKVDDQTHYRCYAKYLDRDEAVFASGNPAHDDWRASRGGFRVDHETEDNTFVLQGDVYNDNLGGTMTLVEPPPVYSRDSNSDMVTGGLNILGRWEHSFADASNLSLQAFYDRTKIDHSILNQKADTFDLDFQYRFHVLKSHEVICGLGYRYVTDEIKDSYMVSFVPDSRVFDVWSGFVQDEISLMDDKIRLTLGSKFEYNDYTGFEVQPNIRVLYKCGGDQSVWASVARAIRTPFRGESDVRFKRALIPPGELGPGMPAVLVQANGSKAVDSETLIAFDLGYRKWFTDTLSIDVATFYNMYDNLMTGELGIPYPDPTYFPKLVVPFTTSNRMDGYSRGLELALDWRHSDYFNLKTSYTYFKMELSMDKGSLDPTSENAEDFSPRHQISLRPSLNLREDLDVDLWARYVSSLPGLNVRGYVTLDVRLAWRPMEHLEISLVGQNLLDPQRLEYVENKYLPILNTEVQRSVYGKLAWTF